MQVLQGITHNTCHQLDGAGAYEWWYVDAISPCGEWGIVYIVFRGIPMSPSYLRNPHSMRAGCAVSVYHRGVRIAFSFTEQPLELAFFDSNSTNVQMKGASLSIDDAGVLRATADVPCDNDGRVIELSITGSASSQASPRATTFTDMHGWVLASPRMKAEFDLKLYENNNVVLEHQAMALAYHDHNMGCRPMHSDFTDWYWGRVHADDRTIVFLSTPSSPDTMHSVYEVDDRGMIMPWADVEITFQRRSISAMGLLSYRQIILRGSSAEHGRMEVVCENAQTCEDSPFYQRYVSTWHINNEAEGIIGTSEYMNVSRMRSSWIRPFLGLPLIIIAGNESV
ncbi:MAG: hypothetical protein ACK5BQ_01980 [Ignavibacteria bacterium]|jgi:carotenoid 1,2-hydratase